MMVGNFLMVGYFRMVEDFWTWSPMQLPLYMQLPQIDIRENARAMRCCVQKYPTICIIPGNPHPYLTLVCSDIGQSCQVHGESRDITMDLSQ